jgi:hypothetical protein
MNKNRCILTDLAYSLQGKVNTSTSQENPFLKSTIEKFGIYPSDAQIHICAMTMMFMSWLISYIRYIYKK